MRLLGLGVLEPNLLSHELVKKAKTFVDSISAQGGHDEYQNDAFKPGLRGFPDG